MSEMSEQPFSARSDMRSNTMQGKPRQPGAAALSRRRRAPLVFLAFAALASQEKVSLSSPPAAAKQSGGPRRAPQSESRDATLASMLAGGAPACEVSFAGSFDESCPAVHKMDAYVTARTGQAAARAATTCVDSLTSPDQHVRLLSARCLEHLPARAVTKLLVIGLAIIDGIGDDDDQLSAVARAFSRADAQAANAVGAVLATIQELNHRPPHAAVASVASWLAATLVQTVDGKPTAADSATSAWAVRAMATDDVDHLAAISLLHAISDKLAACAAVTAYLRAQKPWLDTVIEVIQTRACDAVPTDLFAALVDLIPQSNNTFLLTALRDLDARTSIPAELRGKAASALRVRVQSFAQPANPYKELQDFLNEFRTTAAYFAAPRPAPP